MSAQVRATKEKTRTALTIVDQGRTLGRSLHVPPPLRSFFWSYYADAGRSLPWRRTSVSGYAFIVAEVLLRQTGADRVVH